MTQEELKKLKVVITSDGTPEGTVYYRDGMPVLGLEKFIFKVDIKNPFVTIELKQNLFSVGKNKK